ncbi:hypothetical protein [Saccharothrix variisporea]|uniref:hypothetical protein n=1 Tax=Saccharothrix variisporea TaxID=543527 RepID=UPI0011C3D07C|nr:hypothetical protein [Saccharothrix variisporea]
MEARDAIELAKRYIRERGLDYPVDELVADRFEVGWSVYAPVEVDESDPMAFLDMPVGRAVFLVGDSGRVKESSSSVPPRQAEDDFIAEERAADGMLDIEWAAMQLKEEGAIQSFTIVDTPHPDEVLAAEASEMLEPIVQQLALLGPPGWARFEAVFTLTVSAEIARLRFWVDGRSREATGVPEPILELVRRQRDLAARMSAGPWWRLLLNVTNVGQMAVNYDYGDTRFPDEDLLAPEHYRNDLAAYPRTDVPEWLEDHLGLAPESLSHGNDRIAVDEVEWVRHHSTHTTEKRLFGRKHRTAWHFSAGGPGTTLTLELTTEGKDAPPPQAWTRLVDLSRRHVEPRLVDEFADRVRRGETVEVGGLEVHQGGVAAPGGSLRWPAIGGARIADGQVRVLQVGTSEPAFSVPLSNPNAVLIPALFTAITS